MENGYVNVGQAQRREVGDRVIDQDREGAERPDRLDAANCCQPGYEHTNQYDCRSWFLFRFGQSAEDWRNIASSPRARFASKACAPMHRRLAMALLLVRRAR